MTTRVWTGEGDNGDWATGDNWAPASVPENDDIVILAMPDGGDITAGLNNAGLTLAELRIGPQWNGIIGESDFPLWLNSGIVDFASGADATYLKGNFTTFNVTDGKNRSDMLVFQGEGPTNTTEITTLRVIGGNGTISTIGATEDNFINRVECIGANNITIDMSEGCTAITELVMDSGLVSAAATIVTVEVYGGQLTLSNPSSGGAPITTLNVYDGAVCKYNSLGTITTLTMYGGTWTASDNTNSSVTITNASMYDGLINERNYISSLVWSNGSTLHLGEVVYEPGRDITIS